VGPILQTDVCAAGSVMDRGGWKNWQRFVSNQAFFEAFGILTSPTSQVTSKISIDG
jgi:hypothetical protein